MTELEKYILGKAKIEIVRLEKIISQIKTNSPFIEVPFYLDGVFDSLIYDVRKRKFTEIKYYVGVGNATIIEPMPQYTGYFDEITVKRISLDVDN